MSKRSEALGASRGTHTRRGDLMDVDAALQSQIRNIETTYGKPSITGSRLSTPRA